MRVRIQHVEEKKQEEALLRLTGEDVCSAGLKEYIETDSWRMVSLSCRKGGEIHRVKSSDIFYVESVQEVQLIHAAVSYTHLDVYKRQALSDGEGIQASCFCYRLSQGNQGLLHEA